MRTKLALLAAVILGFLAAIGVRSYVTRRDIEIEERTKRVSVVFARETINRGDVLREHMVKPYPAEVAMITDMHILWSERQKWLGQPLARRVPANHPILQDYFVAGEVERPAEHKIDLGMRAVTIAADQISGVAGLIRPGDRVDVLVTFRTAGQGPQGAGTSVTKLIASNVEVLATDNRTSLMAPVVGGRRRAMPYDRGYSSVTLHVSPLEAALLTFAQESGRVSFVLRNAKDTYQPGATPPVSFSQFDALAAEAARIRARRAQTPAPDESR